MDDKLNWKEVLLKKYTDDPNWVYAGYEPKATPYGIDRKGVKEWHRITQHYIGKESWWALPDRETQCKCLTKIVWNHYILHKKTHEVVVIGSECINKFSSKMKYCDKCDKGYGKHIRKDNLCDECRKVWCNCGKPKQERYPKCYLCKWGRR